MKKGRVQNFIGLCCSFVEVNFSSTLYDMANKLYIPYFVQYSLHQQLQVYVHSRSDHIYWQCIMVFRHSIEEEKYKLTISCPE